MSEQPKHYADMAIEPVDVWRDIFTDAELASIFRALVLKHTMRAGLKGPAIEDACKAVAYARWWLETLEGHKAIDSEYAIQYHWHNREWRDESGLECVTLSEVVEHWPTLMPQERYRVVGLKSGRWYTDNDIKRLADLHLKDDAPETEPAPEPETAEDGKRWRVECETDSGGRICPTVNRGLTWPQAIVVVSGNPQPARLHIVEDTP